MHSSWNLLAFALRTIDSDLLEVTVRFPSAVALLEFPSAPALSRAFFTSNATQNKLLKKAEWDSKSEGNKVVDQLLSVCSGIRAGFFLESEGGKKGVWIFWEKSGRRVLRLEKKYVYEIKCRWCEWWFLNKYTDPLKKGAFAQKMKDFYNLLERFSKSSPCSLFTILQLLASLLSPFLPLLFAFIYRMHSCFLTVWKWA